MISIRITRQYIDYEIEMLADKKWSYRIFLITNNRGLAAGKGFATQEEVCAYAERLILTYPEK